MTAPEPRCLPCSAALRDAADLLQAATVHGFDSVQVHQLVAGMDTERMWRVLHFEVAVALAAVQAYAGLSGLPETEVVEIITTEMAGEIEHGH